MKVACLYIPYLSVQIEIQGTPSLAEQPLVILGRRWDLDAVLDCCPAAAAAGVRAGMSQSQAEILCPSARLIQSREEVYLAAHDALVGVAGRFTPQIETAALGEVYAEVTGLERVAGPDAELVRRLAAEIRSAMGLLAQVGLARNKFTAEQAARAALLRPSYVVPLGEEQSFLAPLPLSSLSPDLETHRRLEMLGIHTLGALAALPRVAIVRQFGSHVGRLHDLALGKDLRPIQPDAPPLLLERRQHLDDPIADRSLLLNHIQKMATQLAQALYQRGYQAEGVRLRLEEKGGAVHQAGAAIKPPSAEAQKLARLAAQLVEGTINQSNRITQPELPVGYRHIVALGLTAYPLRPAYLGATQLVLIGQVQDGPLSRRLERLREVLRGLRVRFGELVIVIAGLVGSPPPQQIQVTLDPQGRPRALVWHDRIHEVMTVYEGWRERRRWWGRPVERDYFRLETVDDRTRVIFYDLQREQWLLERRRV